MEIKNTGNTIEYDDKVQKKSGFVVIGKAVIWIGLVAAFFIPFWKQYHKEYSDIPVICLVSNNYILQQGANDAYIPLHAGAAVLMDADNRRVLFGKNEDAVMPMASTTKIMTCILALESGKMDELAEVSSYAASQPKVHAGLKSGEQYYIRDLVYAMMLESYNDTAVVIAEHIGGSVEGFAAMMNEKAAALGLKNTYFITPNGLDAEDENGTHSTTARELAVLCAYVIKNEEFCNIIQTPVHQFWDTAEKHRITAYNKDAFLQQMSGALGIKTGYTNNAGYCFAGALENQGRVFISVVLACGWPPNKGYKWQDTAALMNYGIEHYQEREINVPAVKGTTSVSGCTGTITEWMFPSGNFTALNGEGDTIKLVTLYPDEICGPVQEKEMIGMRSVLINGECYAVQKLLQTKNMERRDFKYVVHLLLGEYIL